MARYFAWLPIFFTLGAGASGPPDKDVEQQVLKRIDELAGSYRRDPKQPGQPIVALDLGMTRTSDADLTLLARLESLEELTLCFTEVTGAGMKDLLPLKQLRKLDVRHTLVRTEGIKILSGLPALRELDLKNNHIDEAGCKALGNLRALQLLHLSAGRPTAVAPQYLVNLLDLRELTLVDGAVGTWRPPPNPDPKSVKSGFPLPPPQSARWLGELPQLEALNLDNNYLSDADLKILGNLKKLRKLIVTNNPLTEAVVTTVVGLTQLEELELGPQFAFSDATLERLAGLKKLRRLRLLGSYEAAKISPKGLKALAALKDLRHLTLSCAPMPEPDWNSLAGLEELYLYSWPKTPKTPWQGTGLAALKNLRRLATYDIDAKAIAQLDTLEELATHASDEALRHFGNLKKLRTLKLGGSGKSVTDAGLLEIAKLKQLYRLELRNVAISDMGLKRLTALPNLVELDIGANPQLTEAGLRCLSDCKALRMLSLSMLHEKIDVPMLEVLAELRQLRELDLGGRFDGKLSARQADILAGYQHLKRLGVSYITQQEQQKLKGDLPSCWVH